MTYTPADPYTPFFPGSVTQKPDNIVEGQDVLYQHVAPLWDEAIRIQQVLSGTQGAATVLLASATSDTPLTVKGITSQTADVIVAQIGTTDLFKVTASGLIKGVPTSTGFFGSYLSASDTQPAFAASKTGSITWGVGGSTATDTNLYREYVGGTSTAYVRSDNGLISGGYTGSFNAAGIRIENSGSVNILQSSAGSTNAITVAAVGDSQFRFRATSQGDLGWSGGSGTVDATLARSGAAALSLTGSLAVSGTLTAGTKAVVKADDSAGGDLAGTYPNPTIKSAVALPGAPTTTTASTSDNSTKIATTAFVKNQAYATLADPTFTGVPAAPTAATDTNTTQVATTAYVVGQASAVAPQAIAATAATGTSTRFARADHAHAIPSGFITSDMIQNGTITLDDLADALKQAVSPVGTIQAYAGSTAPAGWLICDGSTVPNGSGTPSGGSGANTTNANYAALYAVLGSNFGAAGKIPDLRGRTMVGAGTGVGNGGVGSLTARSLGATNTGLGTESTALGVSHIPQHYHSIDHSHSVADHNHSYRSPWYSGENTYVGGGGASALILGYSGGYYYGGDRSLGTGMGGAQTLSLTQNSGYYGTASPTPVSSMQPSQVVNYIIKY